jgi:phenylalanyl-tRNA synthetase beta chain
MKFSLSWLKDYLDTDANIDKVAETMTRCGLEVEAVIDTSKLLKPFSVAKVISAAKHPNADKLQVLQVDTIDGLKEIVCGAPNARTGMTSIYAPIGAYVPGLEVTLVEKPVRGVVSNGMMCSASELQLSDESDGILELSDTLSVGTPAAEVFGAEPIIDFEVTPNRPDWLGVEGIARDLAAAGLGRFHNQPIPDIKGQFPCPISINVDGKACLYFAGRVIKGVKNGPSPQWLQDKLKSLGLKPISALVDITNYLSFDRARPLHVYDVQKLSGQTIVAGLSPDGETLEALDGKTYALSSEVCAIMDSSGVIGLGGVMGGMSTKVDETTTEVFVEAAYFDPIRIAQTGRELKINSDAQYRFARGVDPQFTKPGLELATKLILDICGGEPSEGVWAGEILKGKPPINFDPAYVAQLTGLDVPEDKIVEILVSLGFEVTMGNPWTLTVPSWRRDIEGKADIVEEIARIYGFNHIPATPLPSLAIRNGGILTFNQARAKIARRALAAFGYSEAVTWSFMPQAKAKLFGGGQGVLLLANPIASELNCMRPSSLPNLLEAAGRNAARGFSGVQLFEIGPIYLGLEPSDQKTTITALKAPDKSRHWQNQGQDALFQLKSDLLKLLEVLNVPLGSLQLVQGQNTEHWHPGRSARLQLGPKQILAEFGEIHPSVLKAMDIEGQYVAFDIRLENLPQIKVKASKSKGALSLSNLMPLSRDFAFLVPQDLAAFHLIKAVKSADKALITEARIFDVYMGQGVAEGFKSLAIEVMIQPQDKTLTEAEIDTLSQKIIDCAEKAGATLRR